jgi:hypothetical protein
LIEDKGIGFTVPGSRFTVEYKKEDRIFKIHGLKYLENGDKQSFSSRKVDIVKALKMTLFFLPLSLNPELRGAPKLS